MAKRPQHAASRLGGIALLISSLLASCAPAAKQTARAPLVAPLPEPEDKTPEVREALERFLRVRWDFDRDATLRYVTPEDAEAPWDRALENPTPALMSPEPMAELADAQAAWFETTSRVLSIEVDGSTAWADVEVIRPTSRLHQVIALRGLKRATVYRRAFKNQPGARRIDDVRAPRSIETFRYQLVLVEGQWRVRMNWSRAAHIDEMPEAVEALKAAASFDGSEAGFLSEHLRSRMKQPMSGTDRELVKSIDAAERAVDTRDFETARQLYDALVVRPATPDFVARRRDALTSIEATYDKRVEAAQLELGEPRCDTGECELRFENRGPDLVGVEFAVEVARKGTLRARIVKARGVVPAGAAETKEFRISPRDKPTGRAWVASVRFIDRALEKALAYPSDKTFKSELQNFRTNGYSGTWPENISGPMHSSAAAIDACPDWPDSPVDVRIEVTGPGAPDVVELPKDIPPRFRDCVLDVVTDLEFDAWNNRSLVRLYPRGHWAL